MDLMKEKMTASNSDSDETTTKWQASKEERIATWHFVMLDKNKNKVYENIYTQQKVIIIFLLIVAYYNRCKNIIFIFKFQYTTYITYYRERCYRKYERENVILITSERVPIFC